MLTTVLVSLLPQIYQEAGVPVQPVPAEPQKTDPDALTIVRGFGTEIPDRPLLTVARSGGSPMSSWWLGNVGMVQPGVPVQVTYWQDEVTLTWEVPASQGGEVELDRLVQIFLVGMTTHFNQLVQPPPYGYGLYNPRWSIGAVTAINRGRSSEEPSGHLLYRTTGQFLANVPVPGTVETGILPPVRIQFTVQPVPLAAASAPTATASLTASGNAAAPESVSFDVLLTE